MQSEERRAARNEPRAHRDLGGAKVALDRGEARNGCRGPSSARMLASRRADAKGGAWRVLESRQHRRGGSLLLGIGGGVRF